MRVLQLPQLRSLRQGCGSPQSVWSLGVRCCSNWHIRRCVEEIACLLVLVLIFSPGIFGTLAGLFIVHRRQRDSEREKRMQYWREQVRLFKLYFLTCNR